jgi:DNA-3-methyladenine glycosylase II
VEIEMIQIGNSNRPILQVNGSCAKVTSNTKPTIKALVDRIFGLRTDLTDFYKFARGDEKLSALSQRFRGMKPPRFPTLFEALVNAISCQQLSLTVGIILLNRLAEEYGVPFKSEKGISYSFPLPERLAAANSNALRKLGFSRQKGRYLIELSQLVTQKKIDLDRLENLNNEDVLDQLYTLRGVGRWTAEYVLLRGLGRLALFPGDDVGAQNRLQRLFNLKKPPDYDTVKVILKQWHPYGGLIYFHLLLDGLSQGGYL